MNVSYYDLLTGDPIYIKGFGHIRSPQLREIGPVGIGINTYKFYLCVLSWTPEDIVSYMAGAQDAAATVDVSGKSVFDLIASNRNVCNLYETALSFFAVEDLVWDDTRRLFVVFGESPASDDDKASHNVVGILSRDNYDDVVKSMLQANYLKLDDEVAEIHHSTDASKALWERVQGYLAEQAKRKPNKDKPEYHLSNIISKLCTVHPTYNLLNVYNLTVFQLYDQFFQCGYIRRYDLDERIFSIHGGEKYSFQNWLKPILQNI